MNENISMKNNPKKEESNNAIDYKANINIFNVQIVQAVNNRNASNDTNELYGKIFPDCKSSFYSNYNMRRHRDSIHLKKNLVECPICHKQFKDIKTHMKTCGKKNVCVSNAENEKLLAKKHALIEKQERLFHTMGDMKNKKRKFSDKNEIHFNTSINKNDNEEIIEKNLTPIFSITKNEDFYLAQAPNAHRNIMLNKNNEVSFTINPKATKTNENINDIIIKNLYQILNENIYLSLANYFILKNCVLGQGKYGTVWFGLNTKNGAPVAIKAQNNNKTNSIFELEIAVMNKLKKYKIFSSLHDNFKLNDKIYLIETIHLPNIEKFKCFCGGKFTISTVYKIGVELLNCIEIMHKKGHLYIDLKSDNVAVLCEPIKSTKSIQKITLIDYGFCEPYINIKGSHLEEKNSPKIHGNTYFSSLNSLIHNIVSRRDDIISLCYFLAYLYLGKLPWTGKNGANIKKNEIIELKRKCTLRDIFGNDLEELIYIFNDANELVFKEKPKYNDYIKKLNERINNEIEFNQKFSYYDWENKLSAISKNFDNLKDFTENNEIVSLFDGYPKFFVEYFLQKYFN